MKMVCFDMDNTLVYATNLHVHAFQKTFTKYKLEKRTNQEIIDNFSLTGEVLVKILFPKLTKKQIQEIVDYHDKIVLRDAKKFIKPIVGAKNILKEMKKKYKIAILSNCKHKEIKATLKAANIDIKQFDAIIGNDDVKQGKPSPDEIFKAKKLLHIKQGYMIGDSTYDIIAGKKAGLKTIAVTTGPHTKSELKKQKPWKLIENISELKKII